MADRVLFPTPPLDGVLVPAPVHEVEARAREFWMEGFTIDPALLDSFWEVVPGTRGYCAVLDYRRPPPIIKPDAPDDPTRSPEIKGIPRRGSPDMSRLTRFLGFHFLDRRLYCLHFRYDDGPMVEAYEFHAFGDSEWIPFPRLRKLEPGIPKDPWDFAESRGVMVQRWPERPPSPPVHGVCVIEDATPEELRPLCKEKNLTLSPVSRGTLVAGHRSGRVGIAAAYELNKVAYVVKVFPTIHEFMCTVFEDGGNKKGCFVSPPAETRHPQLDSVLGETTPRGILRALEVPPELVGLEPDESTGG